ncbi:MAG: glycosyltransferase family 4 protein [Opitutales bacterium]|nr:glycosyltransferase family 4 protein [Opitutales bacterium]NRA25773.1 glycosyltransferase family 4 protein [Opitutales bacterium]
MPKNIGFVSTRFAGSDGVSLESAKWAEVLWDDRHVSYWYSGRNDRSPGLSFCVPEAYFRHPEVKWINDRIWGVSQRDRLVTRRIRELANYLKDSLYRFVEYHKIDILVPQNILAIPMHVPLGIAVTEFLAETNMPAIAHHHDFYWERTRFSVGAIQDYLDMAFPACLPNIRHVVINQAAQEQLSFRKGASAFLVPNVFDFDNPPEEVVDPYTSDFREEIGLTKDDFLILQPTRIVPRKGIEHAIKMVSMLNDPRCKLVISHDAGDEGMEYKNLLVELARQENVDLRFVSTRVGEVRQFDAEGKKIYTLWDIYPHADLVTYPSTYEGFGNALLEAIYFLKPVLINRYSIYIQDIEPKGFRLMEMDGFVTQHLLNEVNRVLNDHQYRAEMVMHNYKVARRFYSYSVLRRILRTVIGSLTGY